MSNTGLRGKGHVVASSILRRKITLMVDCYLKQHDNECEVAFHSFDALLKEGKDKGMVNAETTIKELFRSVLDEAMDRLNERHEKETRKKSGTTAIESKLLHDKYIEDTERLQVLVRRFLKATPRVDNSEIYPQDDVFVQDKPDAKRSPVVKLNNVFQNPNDRTGKFRQVNPGKTKGVPLRFEQTYTSSMPEVEGTNFVALGAPSRLRNKGSRSRSQSVTKVRTRDTKGNRSAVLAARKTRRRSATNKNVTTTPSRFQFNDVYGTDSRSPFTVSKAQAFGLS